LSYTLFYSRFTQMTGIAAKRQLIVSSNTATTQVSSIYLVLTMCLIEWYLVLEGVVPLIFVTYTLLKQNNVLLNIGRILAPPAVYPLKESV